MVYECQTFGWGAICDRGPHGEEPFQTDQCDTFSAVVDAIKSRSWRVSKIKNEWHHTCPDCLGEDV